MSNEAYIIAAARTPIGSFMGALSELPAPRLGAIAIKEALRRAGLNSDQIDECIMGEVLTAGVGQAPARQAALYAGLSTATASVTINKVCGSGLFAVMLAADRIRLQHAERVVAGGQENMSLAPHLLEKSRGGYRMGPQSVADSMVKDGLWDPYNNFHMGSAAELCVREKKSDRQSQDEFARQSYLKAQSAQKQNLFKDEIVGVEIQEKAATKLVDWDEEPGKARFEKMAELKPAFEKDGTITAANASKINDGAAALLLASEKQAGPRPLARVVAQATFAQDPKWFTTAPVGAVKKALTAAGLQTKDIDLWEINEAFSVVAQVAINELGIEAERVNVHGGAVALGHPIGASGARLLTTLIYALKTHKRRYGLATLCIGGGEAVALVVENL